MGARERASRLVDALALPKPWDLNALVAQIAQRRGRTIQLLPVEMSGSTLHGLWVATPRADYIAYPDRTSGYKKDAIVLHEVAHMWLRHPSRDLAELEGRFSRSPYNRQHEDEADEFAEMTLQRAGARPAQTSGESDLMRVIDTFGLDTAHDLHGPRLNRRSARRALHRVHPAQPW